MIERPLLTPDELKSLPKGDFIVMKTGVHPMRGTPQAVFKWGIEFDDEHPYAVPDQGNREVKYADKKEMSGRHPRKNIRRSGKRKRLRRATLTAAVRHSMTAQERTAGTPPKGEKRGGKPIRTSPPKETAPDETEAEIIKRFNRNGRCKAMSRLDFLYRTELPHRAVAVYIYSPTDERE